MILVAKTCVKRSALHAADSFSRSPNTRDRRRPECKPCASAYCRAWRARKKETDTAAIAAKTRRSWLLRMFGLSVEEYEAILSSQGGGCAICAATEPGGAGAFHVDHDHACCPGKKSCGACIRGLLCVRCNHGLGNFRDNPDLLVQAANYLTARHKELAA